MKLATAAVLAATALALPTFASPAFAQTAAPAAAPAATAPVLVEIADDATQVPSLAMTVEAVRDLAVVDPQGNSIGAIGKVLGTADGQPVAVVVEAGGFLGVGSKDVVVTLAQLTKSADGVVLDMSKSQIEAMPAWNG